MSDECWLYHGQCVTEPPENYAGYVYRITNVRNGLIYIGKKAFTHSRKTSLSKKARKGTRKRTTVKVVDSKWMSYYGSSKRLHEDLQEHGAKYFKREILHLCSSKSEMSYWEGFEQFDQKVLLQDSYNDWISLKVFRRYLSK
jgi:hypothetical protein